MERERGREEREKRERKKEDFENKLSLSFEKLKKTSTAGAAVSICKPGDSCRFGKVAEAFVYDNFSRVAADAVAVSRKYKLFFSYF